MPSPCAGGGEHLSRCAGQEADLSAAPSLAVAERGPHHRTVEWTAWETDEFGQTALCTNRYTELACGMHVLREGQWREASAAWRLDGSTAVATGLQFRVSLGANPNTEGAVDLLLPDGRTRLRSRVVGLMYYDAGSGEAVTLAAVRDCTGEQASETELRYPDAFDGYLEADLVYRLALDRFEQDVVLRAAPPRPGAFGLDLATTRLEVWTEFAEPPEPAVTQLVVEREVDPERRAQMVEPDLTDDFLDFGSMQIPAGTAFLSDSASSSTARVCKRWVQIEGATFLVESARYSDLEELLAILPQSEQADAAVAPPDMPSALAQATEAERGRQTHRTPPVLPASFGCGAGAAVPPLTLARAGFRAAAPEHAPGVVIDYTTVVSQADMTFKGDTTYYVTGSVSLCGTTTIEGGTVVKFPRFDVVPSAGIAVLGPTDCQATPYRPAVFTAKDDDSVGEIIAGSTGDPSPTMYYGAGLEFAQDAALANMRMVYAQFALKANEGVELELRHAQLVKCRYPFQALANSTVNVRNALICRPLQGWYTTDNEILIQGHAFTLTGEHLTVDYCERFADDWGDPQFSQVSLTNSLVTDLYVWGDVSPTLIATEEAPWQGAFQPVGAGTHYLAAGSSHRDAGTYAISPSLLAELRSPSRWARRAPS